MGLKGGFAVGGFGASLVTELNVEYYPGIKTDAEMETLEAGGGVTWSKFTNRGEVTASAGDQLWIQVGEDTNFRAIEQPE